MQPVELGHQRFLIAEMAKTSYAIMLKDVERVIRQPKLTAWQGGGAVQAYAFVDGFLVWVVNQTQLFSGVERSYTACRDWLIVLKDTAGLARLGVAVEDVRGPVAFSRLGKVTVLTRLGVIPDESR